MRRCDRPVFVEGRERARRCRRRGLHRFRGKHFCGAHVAYVKRLAGVS